VKVLSLKMIDMNKVRSEMLYVEDDASPPTHNANNIFSDGFV
jgi:hypothetical protein